MLDRHPAAQLPSRLTDAEMRRVHTELLELVAAVCEHHKIAYYLHAGTLLGATRHAGFIPWDDDVDVAMFRADYEQFVDAFPSSALKPDYVSMRTFENEHELPLPYCKVVDDRTATVGGPPLLGAMGLNVDIFPIDGWPRGRVSQFLHRGRMRFWHALLALWVWLPSERRSKLKAMGMSVFHPVVRRTIRLEHLLRSLTRAAQTYDPRAARFVGVTVFSKMQLAPRSAYVPAGQASFEGRWYPAPGDTDAVLQRHYGDYMTLPSLEEREAGQHVEAAYWRN